MSRIERRVEILHDPKIVTLQDMINEYLQAGWEMHGTIFQAGPFLCQCMVSCAYPTRDCNMPIYPRLSI